MKIENFEMFWWERRRLMAASWSSSPAQRGSSQREEALVLLKDSSKVGLRVLGASVSLSAAHHITQHVNFCASGSITSNPHSPKTTILIYTRKISLAGVLNLGIIFGISDFCSCKIMLLNKLSPSISHISVGRKLELFHIVTNA